MASSSRASKRPEPSPESFKSLSERDDAAEILQSYEKLSWHSFQRCESLTQTRLHFHNVIAGFTAEEELAQIDWPEDRTPFPSREGESSRRASKGKGKEVARDEGNADAARDGNSRSKGRESLGSGGGSAKKKSRN